MNEQFDRNLRNHIRDTFDHYDDLMADDGWEKFKKQKNKKRRFIFWYGLPSGIAAALAFLWLFNSPTTEVLKIKTINNAQIKVSKSPNSFSEDLKEKAIKADAYGKVEKDNNRSLTPAKKNIEQLPKQNEIQETFVTALSDKSRPQLNTINATPINLIKVEANYPAVEIAFDQQNLASKNITEIANQKYLSFKADLLKNANTYPSIAVAEDKKTDKKKNSKLNFAVDANTFYSFTSTGVNNDLNLGLGVLSELKLSKRLSINSGISINKQSAVYQNIERNAGGQNFDSPASPNSSISLLSRQSISIPESVKTNAKLIGFDIPVNLKYNIPLGKAKTFISTGISSYSLLNQSYVNEVSVVNYSLKSAATTTVLRSVDKGKEDAFSNFQFARTVNFSFGILYPVSNKNSISVEPFVKYPIAGFGNRDLEIGSGGISFKLNFGK